MADKTRKWTDKQLRSMEKEIESIYTQAQEEVTAKWNAYMQRAESRIAKYQQAYDNALKDGDKELIESTKKRLADAKQSYTLRNERYKTMVKSVTKDMYEINKRAVAYMNDQLPKVYVKNYAELQGNLGTSFFLQNESTIKRMIQDGDIQLPYKKMNYAKDVAWNTKKLNSSVLQGIIQGESIPQISDRILPIVNNNKTAAIRNARTMVTGAESRGRLDSFNDLQKKGMIVEKQWISTGDSRTRDWHLVMDGQHVPLDEPFVDGNGDELDYPADPKAEPRTVYNCRCRMISHITGFKNALGEEVYFDESEMEGDFDAHEQEIIKEQVRRFTEYNKQHKNVTVTDPKTFKKKFDKAKSTLPKGGEWRVDDTHAIRDYKNDKLFVFKGGSVVAVTPKGDIISVCKNMKGAERGSDLLRLAVENGGDRLDAFGRGLYQFYTKNGFEPVSWTRFNVQYAPHDWVKGRDRKEPVIFYQYTGKKTDMSYSRFLREHKAYKEYDDAMAFRDKLIANTKKR